MALVARSRVSRAAKSRLGDGATFTDASGFAGLGAGGGVAAIGGDRRGVDRSSVDGDGTGPGDGAGAARGAGVGASTTGGAAFAGGTRSTGGGAIGGGAEVSGEGGADATGGGAGAIGAVAATVGEVVTGARAHPAPDARMSTMLAAVAAALTWSSVLMLVTAAYVRSAAPTAPAPAPRAPGSSGRTNTPVTICFTVSSASSPRFIRRRCSRHMRGHEAFWGSDRCASRNERREGHPKSC
jgi:hypothetical protein